MKRVNQKLCQKLMIVEEKLQMHESNQVIDDKNEEPPSSPWTQFVIGSFVSQAPEQGISFDTRYSWLHFVYFIEHLDV